MTLCPSLHVSAAVGSSRAGNDVRYGLSSFLIQMGSPSDRGRDESPLALGDLRGLEI